MAVDGYGAYQTTCQFNFFTWEQLIVVDLRHERFGFHTHGRPETVVAVDRTEVTSPVWPASQPDTSVRWSGNVTSYTTGKRSTIMEYSKIQVNNRLRGSQLP